jgi:hypothetical protein
MIHQARIQKAKVKETLMKNPRKPFQPREVIPCAICVQPTKYRTKSNEPIPRRVDAIKVSLPRPDN